MKLIILALALSTTLSLAQAPAPADQSAKSTDPTADTDDPTLLKAQIMMLDNAREIYRSHLAQISDFQEYEKRGDLAAAKRQKLQAVLNNQAMQHQNAQISNNAQMRAQHDADNQKQQIAAEIKAREERQKAVAAAKAAAAAKTPAPK